MDASSTVLQATGSMVSSDVVRGRLPDCLDPKLGVPNLLHKNEENSYEEKTK